MAACLTKSNRLCLALGSCTCAICSCAFCSNLYDVSRTTINAIDQITYTEDDLYLDPRKLIIEGESNNQIAGFGSYIIEKGRQKDQNYIAKLRQDLELGWFTRKDNVMLDVKTKHIQQRILERYPAASNDYLLILMLLRVYRHSKPDTLERNFLLKGINSLWK